ncbi:MAG TPA: hypothetical protein PLT60_01200 [Candidatus Pacearchaeota archaeon]|jgi:hypothetical protein|nr:hypothetical protein [Candidatus Pacearchaeota archaeon]HOC96783.1 hypothetical protein [Candidatus Pacearchaeota archaeon]HOF44113.1 hypothetical protein [Candidatus Pacearchaeota archaeon]HOH04104.1 hypothetical protein [Candidatus Pacearchaeota archaeon]HOR52294.1 hypothetical protein [Candidatus Pacearchaeota archaeon]
MEKITFKLPQIIFTESGLNRYNYLERIASNSNEPKVNLTFQEDSGEDSRIIAIKYQVEGEEGNDVLYYSEGAHRFSIITANLRFPYIGRVLVRDRNNHKIGVDFENFFKKDLRQRHINKINKRGNIIKNLSPEYVAKRYKDIFYRLNIQD